jgi:hydroxymethylpyrimidine pyrophosphatase-like HAD family hydrolase
MDNADLNPEAEEALQKFLSWSQFASCGGVVTDLDGTVVFEHEGRIFFPTSVTLGLKEICTLGRPLVLNTLRFPNSVIHVLGAESYAICQAPIPVVLLNGSQLGTIEQESSGALTFKEIAAFPLTAAEIAEVLRGIEGLIRNGIDELLVFYYPRDWRIGEIIWTPRPDHVAGVKAKYLSASAVAATGVEGLKGELTRQDICMVFLLINAPQDKLMAYQHAKRSNFVTHQGVDKLSGARRMAEHLKFDLVHSFGLGDTEMDRFLSGTGCAVVVGSSNVEHRGIQQTVHLRDFHELAAFLFKLAALNREYATVSKTGQGQP